MSRYESHVGVCMCGHGRLKQETQENNFFETRTPARGGGGEPCKDKGQGRVMVWVWHWIIHYYLRAVYSVIELKCPKNCTNRPPKNSFKLTLFCSVVTVCTTRCNTQQFYVLPTQCIYVFWWIWEQTAITSLYSINWLVCIREEVCLLRGTVWIFICFVWISEQTAIISLYSINWLVCITERKCLLRGTDWIFICFVGSQNKQRLFPYTALTDWFV